MEAAFQAIAEPNRRRILELLAESDELSHHAPPVDTVPLDDRGQRVELAAVGGGTRGRQPQGR